MCFIHFVSVFIIAIYILLIAFIVYGWFRQKKFTSAAHGAYPFVSVVIAVRNEEKNIENLLKNLLKQDYPHSRFEIIMVDDHSEDRSADIIRTYIEQNPEQIRLLTLAKNIKSKKYAVDEGIKAARGELILTTDADCRFSTHWITSFIAFYLSENNLKMIIGLVDYEEKINLFSSLQNLEFLSLTGSAAGAAAAGRPIFCSGANLMFEKKTYKNLKDPLNKKVVSGDDTFLLHQIKKYFPNGIKILKSREAVVITQPSPACQEFLNQRIRWTSKARHYRDLDTIAVGLIVFITNLAVIGWILGALIIGAKIFTWLILLKTMTDWLMITPVLSFFEKKRLHFFVPLLALIYPFYSTALFLISAISKVHWKGRIY